MKNALSNKEILKAYLEGKTIQYRRVNSFSSWNTLTNSNFDFDKYEYRVYEEPSYMKLGKSELEMLRRDYTELRNSHSKEDLATATVRYNIFQLGDIIDVMENMRSLIINQMPLKEKYKEELDYYRNMYNTLGDN